MSATLENLALETNRDVPPPMTQGLAILRACLLIGLISPLIVGLLTSIVIHDNGASQTTNEALKNALFGLSILASWYCAWRLWKVFHSATGRFFCRLYIFIVGTGVFLIVCIALTILLASV